MRRAVSCLLALATLLQPPAGVCSAFAASSARSAAAVSAPGVAARSGADRVVTDHYRNGLGHFVRTRVRTRGLRQGEPAFHETLSYFDGDGQLTRRVFPELNEVRYRYDTGPRGAQQDVVEVRLVAGPRGDGHGNPAEDQVTTMSYEPLFRRLASVTEPRGTSESFVPPLGTASAERYTTRYLFDYQESSEVPEDAAVFGISLYPLRRGLGDLNGDGRTNQAQGNVVRVVSPSVLLSDTNVQQVFTETRWNDRGQPVAVIDPLGNVTELRYWQASAPGGLSGPGGIYTGALSGELTGYLRAVVRDSGAVASPRRGTFLVPPPTNLSTWFAYDAVGNVTRTRNPRGVETELTVNALDEVVRIRRAVLDVSSGAAAPGPGFETRLHRDASGRLVRREVEDRGNAATDGFVDELLRYDTYGSLIERKVEVATGVYLTTRLLYDPNRNLVEVVSPQGRRVVSAFDERDLPLSVTRGAGTPEQSTVTFDYDGNANLSRSVDAEDNDGDGQREATTFGFDGFDRPAVVQDALSNRALTFYDVAGQAIETQVFGHPPGGASTATRVLLARTRARHDELGRVVRVDRRLFLAAGAGATRPVVLQDGTLRFFDVDARDGDVTDRFRYDAASRLVASFDDDWRQTTTRYDGANRPVDVQDEAGNRRLVAYDANGNPVAVTSVERVSNNPGTLEQTRTARYAFDALDRLVRVTDNAGQTSYLTHDSLDRVVERADPEGPALADPLGLFPGPGQTGQINAPGNRVRYRYDGAGRLLEEAYDLAQGGQGGPLLDLSNPFNQDGRVTLTYTWDGDSRLTAIRDDAQSSPAGFSATNATRFGYDALGRRVTTTLADGSQYRSSFDRDDNLRRTIDPNGTTATRTHDVLNRLVAVDVTRGVGVRGTTHEAYAYDGLGRLTRSTDDNGAAAGEGPAAVVERVHDSLSRLVEERQDGRVFSCTYSGVGERLSCLYPGGRRLDYRHDALHRVVECRASASGSPQGATSLVAREAWIGPGMRALTRQHGNGTVLSYLDGAGQPTGYDAVNRVVRERVLGPGAGGAPGGGAALLDRAYLYNRASQRTAELRHDEGRGDAYTYDSMYRVATAAYDQPLGGGVLGVERDVAAETFSLDGVGNRREVDVARRSTGTSTDLYTINNVNEYTSVASGAAPAVAQAHDANGNLVHDGTRQFTYDYRNRLVAVSSGGVTVATYRYDAGNRRVEKTLYQGGVATSATRYVWDGWREVEEQDAGVFGSPTLATFVHGSRGIDEHLQVERVGVATLYLHQNVRGDVVAVTDAAGAVVERRRYDAFGRQESPSSVGVAFGFQGARLDDETGLVYLRNRTYDPVRGRFLQRDPVWDPVNVGNQYSWPGNNPPNNRDPSGQWTVLGVVAVVAAAYGIYQFLATPPSESPPGGAPLTEPQFHPPTPPPIQEGTLMEFGPSTRQAEAEGAELALDLLFLAAAKQPGPRLVPRTAPRTAPRTTRPRTRGRPCPNEPSRVPQQPNARGLYENLDPENLARELAKAEELGVRPLRPGDPGFDDLMNSGSVKWVVLEDGQLAAVPKFVPQGPGLPVWEVPHTVASGGAPVRAAGEADIFVAGDTTFGTINTHSGHYAPAGGETVGQQTWQSAGYDVTVLPRD